MTGARSTPSGTGDTAASLNTNKSIRTLPENYQIFYGMGCLMIFDEIGWFSMIFHIFEEVSWSFLWIGGTKITKKYLYVTITWKINTTWYLRAKLNKFKINLKNMFFTDFLNFGDFGGFSQIWEQRGVSGLFWKGPDTFFLYAKNQLYLRSHMELGELPVLKTYWN